MLSSRLGSHWKDVSERDRSGHAEAPDVNAAVSPHVTNQVHAATNHGSRKANVEASRSAA